MSFSNYIFIDQFSSIDLQGTDIPGESNGRDGDFCAPEDEVDSGQ